MTDRNIFINFNISILLISISKDLEKGKDESSNNDDGVSSLYDLYAVANHLGGMSGGHYTAMVKCDSDTANSLLNTAIDSNSNINSNISNAAVALNNQNSSETPSNLLRARSTSSACSAAAGSVKEESDNPQSSPLGTTLDTAWMCFDDDVVSAVPLHALESTIVSGEFTALFRILISSPIFIFVFLLLYSSIEAHTSSTSELYSLFDLFRCT